MFLETRLTQSSVPQLMFAWGRLSSVQVGMVAASSSSSRTTASASSSSTTTTTSSATAAALAGPSSSASSSAAACALHTIYTPYTYVGIRIHVYYTPRLAWRLTLYHMYRCMYVPRATTRTGVVVFFLLLAAGPCTSSLFTHEVRVRECTRIRASAGLCICIRIEVYIYTSLCRTVIGI